MLDNDNNVLVLKTLYDFVSTRDSYVSVCVEVLLILGFGL